MSAARGTDHGFDVVVIGSGPAGQKAAMHAAQCGKRVAVIERDRHVGGSCVYSGAIPSKALREHALRQRVRQADLEHARIESLLDGVGKTAAAHDAYLSAHLERNHIVLLRGRAQFVGAHELSMQKIDGSQVAVSAPVIVIAIGIKKQRSHVLVKMICSKRAGRDHLIRRALADE